MSDEDRSERRRAAQRRLGAAIAALATHAQNPPPDPDVAHGLALAVINRCNHLAILDAIDADDTPLDDAFARFMEGEDERDDIEELLAALAS